MMRNPRRMHFSSNKYTTHCIYSQSLTLHALHEAAFAGYNLNEKTILHKDYIKCKTFMNMYEYV